MSAVLYSALKITDFSQIWIFPLAFLVFCLIYFLACWLFLWLISLPISMKKEYDKPSRFYYRLFNCGYRLICSAARVRIHVTGKEKVPKNTRFLFVSNHLSRFDPMIESAVLEKTPMAFISKPSNFKIPIGRRYMKRSCYMAIDRENPMNAIKTVDRAAELISSNTVSVGVYPEGHRGTGEALQDFSAGCLLAATKAKAPVVVGTIWGTEKIHRNFPWHRTDVYFDIIDVIYSEKQRTAVLAERIKNEMEAQINERKKEEKK